MTPFQYPPVQPWLDPGESLKACIITFNFGRFIGSYSHLQAWKYFVLKHPRKVDVTCNVAQVFGTICLLEKPLKISFIHFS